jgi:hypothetical protein
MATDRATPASPARAVSGQAVSATPLRANTTDLSK